MANRIGSTFLDFLLLTSANITRGKFQENLIGSYEPGGAGIAAISVKNGDVLFKDASGMSNVEHDIPDSGGKEGRDHNARQVLASFHKVIQTKSWALTAAISICFVFSAPEIIAAEDERIDEIFSDYDSTEFPGCSMAVYKNGEIVQSRGYGLANLEHGVANRPDTVFRIASTSKQFTAAAIALLAANGELSLGDDIDKFFPELPDYGTPITVRHLIHHTSGLRDYIYLAWLADWGETYTVDETLRLILRQQGTHFLPGTKYEYSNTGYFLMAHIVESVTGQTLREWADENIFAPLGMRNTHFHDDYTHVVKNRAVGYAVDENGVYKRNSPDFNHVGGAGILTTVEDLLAWDSNFYENKLSGGPELIRQLETPGKLDNGEVLTYAFGLDVDEFEGTREIVHTGGYAGFQSSMNRYPDHRLSVAVLCNDAGATPYYLARSVANLYLGSDGPDHPDEGTELKEAPIVDEEAAFAGDIDELVGDYINENTASVISIVSNGSSLFYTDPGGRRFRLDSRSDGGFVLDGIPFNVRITFKSAEPQALSMIVKIEDQDPVTHRRFERFIPGSEQLPDFAGSYYSVELDYELKLAVNNGVLSAIRRKGPSPLQPLERDMFVFGDGIVLEFSRATAGEIDGLRMHAYGMRDLTFVKRQSVQKRRGGCNVDACMGRYQAEFRAHWSGGFL